MLEADGPRGLAEELRGTIESVVEDELEAAIEQLAAASALTVDDVARRAVERAEDESATRRLAARIGPRVVEILDGGREPRAPRRPRRARRLH